MGVDSYSGLIYSYDMKRAIKDKQKLAKKLNEVPDQDVERDVEISVSANPVRGKEYGAVVYADAFMLYVYKAMQIRDVGKALDIPYHTVKKWATRDKWGERKANAESELIAVLESETLQILKDNRSKVMLKHLQIGDNLDKAINSIIIDNQQGDRTTLSPSNVSDLGKALKNSADVQHRIVRVNDTQTTQDANNIFNGPVTVNASPRLAGKTIDV